jgi:hypothetical protein
MSPQPCRRPQQPEPCDFDASDSLDLSLLRPTPLCWSHSAGTVFYPMTEHGVASIKEPFPKIQAQEVMGGDTPVSVARDSSLTDAPPCGMS